MPTVPGDQVFHSMGCGDADVQCVDFGLDSSFLASPLGFLPSLDQLIRPGEHFRRDRQADLLCRLEINHELKLRRLLDR
jgi:hypothetical protein